MVIAKYFEQNTAKNYLTLSSKLLLIKFFYACVWQVMFESGYLTLFGKELGENKCQARQEAQKALVLNALENFKEFDKIFPALVAGLPIHVFKSAYSAREVSLILLLKEMTK